MISPYWALRLRNSLTHGSGVSMVAAVWGEALPGAFGAGEAGYILGTNLDALISTRSSHSAADVDTQLSGTHGASSWEGYTPAVIADAVWDEDATEHLGGDKAGQYLVDAGATADPAAIADAVWDELSADHVTADTMGAIMTALYALTDPSHAGPFDPLDAYP